jgi:hypothetical protein
MDGFEGKDFFLPCYHHRHYFFPFSTFIQTKPGGNRHKMKNYFKEECKSVLDVVVVVDAEEKSYDECNGLTRIKRESENR